MLLETTTATKSGRAWNGAHRDAGVIVHLVLKMPENTAGFWGVAALCGTNPGSRGNGWHKSNQQASCKRCLKK